MLIITGKKFQFNLHSGDTSFQGTLALVPRVSPEYKFHCYAESMIAAVSVRVGIHCRVFFRANARQIYERKLNRGKVWNATRKRECCVSFIFYVYAWPSKHFLYFIYARKISVRIHVKITRQWKSTVRVYFYVK